MTTAGTVPPQLPASPDGPPRLYRAGEGTVVAGVCRGLALHLGVDVTIVRLAFVVLGVAGGAGVAMYAAFWIFAPLDVTAGESERSGPPLAYTFALAALGLGAVLLATWTLGVRGPTVWPLIVIGVGVVMLWRQADDAQRERWRAATTGGRRWGLARAAIGLGLILVGAALLLSGSDIGTALTVLVPIVVVVFGLALLSGPWWVRMARDLAGERAARIREQERAEIAAHLHDSVLHTLALIQRSVDNPREVARLTRTQERQLRTWLYRPTGNPETRLAAAVTVVAAEVEDEFGVAIEVVTVGDCEVDERLRVLLPAAREALVNAAKYAAGASISVYAEVTDHAVEVFVRDRGPGFDLSDVPPDRLGIKHSIVSRVERAGGTAAVHTAVGEGTEVALEMPHTSGARSNR